MSKDNLICVDPTFNLNNSITSKEGVHSTAIIAPGAVIMSGVTIGAYSIIGSNVVIGENCKIHSHVVIDGWTKLGANNEIYPFASIGLPPQDLKFSGEDSRLEIGNNNKIREYVTLQPGTKHGTMKTTIGSHNLFMANSHVAHDCRVGDHNILANSCALAGHVTLQNRVILGGLSAVHQYCRIGEMAILSGGSMIHKDVPPYCLGQGDRCVIRGINLVGLKRAGLSSEIILGIRKAYRHLFLRGGNPLKNKNLIEDHLKSINEVDFLLGFLDNSKRGFITSSKRGLIIEDAFEI